MLLNLVKCELGLLNRVMPPFLAINARITMVTESRPKMEQITKLQVLLREKSLLCWTTAISLLSTSCSPEKQLKITRRSISPVIEGSNTKNQSPANNTVFLTEIPAVPADRGSIQQQGSQRSQVHMHKKSGRSTCGEVVTC